MQFLKNTLLALSAGYVLFFFSERLFWTAFKPGDSVPVLLLTWALYSVAAYLFLSLVWWQRAYAAYRVFLAGAVFGWLVEGTVVGTLYGTESSAPFPLSLLVTGVSWHALISAWVGWHFLRRSLGHVRPSRAAAWSAGLGLFWGTWATFLWRETPPVIVPARAFASHAAVATAVLAACYWVAGRVGVASFRPRPLGVCLAAGALGVFCVQQVKALGVQPLVVLPALVWLAVTVLRRAAQTDPPGDPPPDPAARVGNLACLLLMPLVATGAYVLWMNVSWWRRVPVPVIVLYALTAPASAAVLAWAVFRCVAPRRRPARADVLGAAGPPPAAA
jgi:hypothetical protein